MMAWVVGIKADVGGKGSTGWDVGATISVARQLNVTRTLPRTTGISVRGFSMKASTQTIINHLVSDAPWNSQVDVGYLFVECVISRSTFFGYILV